ncbi:MAG: hypothetical protein COU29_00615 [Candidatus Magasanikbacteria bacterium CG10_big_fil_rev_8_21_14_0_10_36_32]|uniref:YoaR-like putative peptidoglycan binding domain-containing protein n=1 Tax=Candidatus Magasanikbacteria bacterium CG10_big_fil_rev_8_21_14_0_10_36_32 TaxID=1974646 RepID=A0A2M6W7H5_9BACT|nr:MAG: hypothetical protein COU29_00615 [Candidatus Magasanikbacteria bacterium CG10_big_fil_rev_8_21_14_0_10_36_32]
MAEGAIKKIAEKIQLIPARKNNWKTVVIILAVVFGLLAVVFGVSVVYSKTYVGKVYPGIYLGHYDLSGWTADDVKKFVDSFSRRLSQEGLVYMFEQNGQSQRVAVNPALISSEAAIETIFLSNKEFAGEILNIGRGESFWFKKMWLPLWYRIKTIHLSLPVKIDRQNFQGIIENALEGYVIEPRDANIHLSSINPLAYELTLEQSGEVFDYEQIIDDTVQKLSEPSLESIVISKRLVIPSVTKKDLAAAEENILRAFNFGPAILSHTDTDAKETQVWSVGPELLVKWLKPVYDSTGKIKLELKEKEVGQYLENLRVIVDQPAEDAKFSMENGKVSEFKNGHSGRSLNVAKTYGELNNLFIKISQGENVDKTVINLAVDQTEPKLKLSDINDYGITGIFGVGTSTFYDSHNNRIKNIANAVERLNGIIIKPGEEFSSIKYAGSFTEENGFLPEEIIKGNKIIKEVGGGMCQIGTTLFRMAMNSGMPITERTNHSLVVGYYADPINGNPGTDATLYEPILDFKFMNDTGGYLLLQTEINYKKQMLIFTLWGTPDGRSGFYSRPIVSKWIPAGLPQEIKTTTLKPGETKCQNAFRGANASFTYTRFNQSGEKIERVFSSYYRPLPKMCMTGISPNECPDGKTTCDIIVKNTATSTPSATPNSQPLLAD